MNTATQSKPMTAAAGGKYLTFALGKEEYGLPILKVRELIGYMDVTPVPRTPPHVKGVINLRGQVIGVCDLRTRFGMESATRTEQTCIVVVEIDRDNVRLCAGLIVDRVSEVLTIPADSIEEPPSFGVTVDTSFILGVGKVGKAVKILLDIDRVMTTADAENLAAVTSGEATAAAA